MKTHIPLRKIRKKKNPDRKKSIPLLLCIGRKSHEFSRV
jgi:hypothetical protein